MDETERTQTGPAYSSAPDDGTQPCPWCGAPVEPDRPACRACGFDFEHMDAGAPPGEGKGAKEDAAVGEGKGEGEGESESAAELHPLEVACFECGEINHRDADFCRKCGAAIGQYSTVKPFERVLAIGKFARRAFEARRKADTWKLKGWLWSIIILMVLMVFYLFMIG